MKHLILALSAFAILTSSAVADLQHYEKGQVLRQWIGTTGADKADATRGLMSHCSSHPFIVAGLAELSGVEDISYESIRGEIFAGGTCLVTFLETITEVEAP